MHYYKVCTLLAHQHALRSHKRVLQIYNLLLQECHTIDGHKYVIQMMSSHIPRVNWVSFSNYINIYPSPPRATPSVSMKVNVH